VLGSVIVDVVEHQEGLFSFPAARALAAVGFEDLPLESSVPIATVLVPALAVRLLIGPDLLRVSRLVGPRFSAFAFLASGLEAFFAAVSLLVKLGERLGRPALTARLHVSILASSWDHARMGP
jgi:hypothetical protein